MFILIGKESQSQQGVLSQMTGILRSSAPKTWALQVPIGWKLRSKNKNPDPRPMIWKIVVSGKDTSELFTRYWKSPHLWPLHLLWIGSLLTGQVSAYPLPQGSSLWPCVNQLLLLNVPWDPALHSSSLPSLHLQLVSFLLDCEAWRAVALVILVYYFISNACHINTYWIIICWMDGCAKQQLLTQTTYKWIWGDLGWVKLVLRLHTGGHLKFELYYYFFIILFSRFHI